MEYAKETGIIEEVTHPDENATVNYPVPRVISQNVNMILFVKATSWTNWWQSMCQSLISNCHEGRDFWKRQFKGSLLVVIFYVNV